LFLKEIVGEADGLIVAHGVNRGYAGKHQRTVEDGGIIISTPTSGDVGYKYDVGFADLPSTSTLHRNLHIILPRKFDRCFIYPIGVADNANDEIH